MNAGRLVIAAGAVYAAPSLAAVPALRAPGVMSRFCTRAPVVALTFDDGPSPQGTPAVLDQLAALGLSATFFVVGEQVSRHPQLVGEVVSAGHEIGVHGYRHLAHALTPPRTVSADLARAVDVVARASGVEQRWLRAPYGAASLATVAFARRQSLSLVAWSRWGRDWERSATPAGIAGRTLSRVRAGDVLLLHDSDAYAARGSWRATAGALAQIARGLADRGLRAVSLGEAVQM